MPVSVFSLFLSFTEKEYQTESKRSETFGRISLGQKSPGPSKRVGGAPYPPGRVPLSRGRLGDPPDVRPTPKIPINTETPRKNNFKIVTLEYLGDIRVLVDMCLKVLF